MSLLFQKWSFEPPTPAPDKKIFPFHLPHPLSPVFVSYSLPFDSLGQMNLFSAKNFFLGCLKPVYNSLYVSTLMNLLCASLPFNCNIPTNFIGCEVFLREAFQWLPPASVCPQHLCSQCFDCSFLRFSFTLLSSDSILHLPAFIFLQNAT